MAHASRWWKAAGPHDPGLEEAVRMKCLMLGLQIQQLDEGGLRVLTLTPAEQAAADELNSWLTRRGQIVNR